MAEISNPEALAVGIADRGCIVFGDMTLTSGAASPVYFNLHGLASINHRSALSVTEQLAIRDRVVDAYGVQLAQFDDYHHIIGVPRGAYTTAGMLSHPLKLSALQLQTEQKTHGLGNTLEGFWHEGETVVMVDDLISTGKSTLEAKDRIETIGLNVGGAVMLLDRGQGGLENLQRVGLRAEAALRIATLIEILTNEKRLTPSQISIMRGYFLGDT